MFVSPPPPSLSPPLMGSQESLPRVFSSNDLMAPLISLLKGVGIHNGAKKAVEVQSLLSLSCLPSPSQDICEWMELMLEVPLLPPSLPSPLTASSLLDLQRSGTVSKQLIGDIRVLSADLNDLNFLHFLSSLEKVSPSSLRCPDLTRCR